MSIDCDYWRENYYFPIMQCRHVQCDRCCLHCEKICARRQYCDKGGLPDTYDPTSGCIKMWGSALDYKVVEERPSDLYWDWNSTARFASAKIRRYLKSLDGDILGYVRALDSVDHVVTVDADCIDNLRRIIKILWW